MFSKSKVINSTLISKASSYLIMNLQGKSGMKIVSVKLRRPSVDGRTQLAIPRQCLPNKEKFDVVVGEIINPGHFYLQRGKF